MQLQHPHYFPAQHVPPEGGSLRDILYVLFRRKKALLLFFWASFLGVLLLTLLSPEIYQSEARVLIRVGRESLALDPTVDGPTMALSQSRENEVNSELAIIKSRLLAEQVVDRITPEIFLADGNLKPEAGRNPTSLGAMTASIRKALQKTAHLFGKEETPSYISLRENAINKMIKNLKVGVEQKSHVITISFDCREPQFGQRVLDLFLTLFQDHHIKIHSSIAPPRFFQERAGNLYEKLQEKENALEAFRAEHNIASISIQKETLSARISRIQSDLAEINSRIAASRANNASLEQGLARRSREVELGRVAGRKSTTSDAIKARLFDFRIKEADLSARYPDQNRQLVEVREQIRVAEAALNSEKETDEVTTGVDPTYQAMQLALETGRARLQGEIASLEALEKTLREPIAELAALVKNETIESRLRRDVKLLEEEYLRYRQDVQRTDISRNLDLDKVSNLSIIQPATLPVKAIKPNKPVNLALGILLGLFGGISLAFFLEYLDASLKTKEDVERRLGLYVLASVPCEESESCM
ncbi:MAG: hypothetical protein KKG47_11485 [Proteobacteria bacterium]|nr:hypothetical protein [Pseudomonadota bacterium]MBU1739437.1 hypothetical protein [Pseudomonadota bacterium]